MIFNPILKAMLTQLTKKGLFLILDILHYIIFNVKQPLKQRGGALQPCFKASAAPGAAGEEAGPSGPSSWGWLNPTN